MKLSLVRHPPSPSSLIARSRPCGPHGGSFRLAKTKKKKQKNRAGKTADNFVARRTKLFSGVVGATVFKNFSVIIFPLLWSKCRAALPPMPLLLPPLGKISLQNWFSLRVYLRRFPRIECYTLHKEQTNSFFNAPLAGFQKRASAIAAMRRERFDGMKARSLEMFFMFWKQAYREEIIFILTNSTSIHR